MKFIPPMEISSKIMTLIQDAEQHLIIVSPYVEITKWDKMKKCLQKAQERNVKITFFSRKNVQNQDLSFLRQIKVEPILVQDLHAKIYLNENFAIVTSQNITHYSDINSIDIGYITETALERKELEDFINKNLGKISIPVTVEIPANAIKSPIVKRNLKTADVEVVYQKFQKKFWESKFTSTATYIFSGNLLPFGDVLIAESFTVKFKKNHKDCEFILKLLKKIKPNNYFQYKTDFLDSHPTHYYFTFSPVGFEDDEHIDYLVKDYVSLSKDILERY